MARNLHFAQRQTSKECEGGQARAVSIHRDLDADLAKPVKLPQRRAIIEGLRVVWKLENE